MVHAVCYRCISCSNSMCLSAFKFDGYSHVTAQAGATVYLKQMASTPSIAFNTNKPTASGRHPAGNGAYLTVSQATCNHHNMHLSEAKTQTSHVLTYTVATRTFVHMTNSSHSFKPHAICRNCNSSSLLTGRDCVPDHQLQAQGQLPRVHPRQDCFPSTALLDCVFAAYQTSGRYRSR